MKSLEPDVVFINNSGLEFRDISSEEYRAYTFSVQDGVSDVTIEDPLWLHISESGGHRIFDAEGISHYIPTGWILLSWKAKPDQPNFEF